MKRFLFLSMLVFIAIMVWVSVHEKEDDVPLPQKLERAMRLTRMMEYQDDDYEYIIRYPAFFEQQHGDYADSLRRTEPRQPHYGSGNGKVCFRSPCYATAERQ